jgi:hypothetical protein
VSLSRTRAVQRPPWVVVSAVARRRAIDATVTLRTVERLCAPLSSVDHMPFVCLKEDPYLQSDNGDALLQLLLRLLE